MTTNHEHFTLDIRDKKLKLEFDIEENDEGFLTIYMWINTEKEWSLTTGKSVE